MAPIIKPHSHYWTLQAVWVSDMQSLGKLHTVLLLLLWFLFLKPFLDFIACYCTTFFFHISGFIGHFLVRNFFLSRLFGTWYLYLYEFSFDSWVNLPHCLVIFFRARHLWRYYLFLWLPFSVGRFIFLGDCLYFPTGGWHSHNLTPPCFKITCHLDAFPCHH